MDQMAQQIFITDNACGNLQSVPLFQIISKQFCK